MHKNREKVFDQLRMLECLHLAEKGAGYVNPNPMVGAVVVKDGKVIGKGYHKQYGGPHAEVFAIRQAGPRVRGATLYVNLEPCCYYGKTPPCTDLIMKSGISRVVIGMKDPNPQVNGKGIDVLQSSRIRVDTGILENEAKKLNETFIKFITTGVPFVIVKIAQTLDGKIADHKGRSRWITNDYSRRIVHALRARYDAALVGANTVIRDDPQLTVRGMKGRNPYRVIIDGNFSVPLSSKVFRDRWRHQTLLFLNESTANRGASRISQLQKRGVHTHSLKGGHAGVLPVHRLLKVLAGMNISSVVVEGGAWTIARFMDAGVVDKLVLFVAPKVLGEGLSAFQYLKTRSLRKPFHFSRVSSWNLKGDLLIEAYVPR